jgi:hypothetical protein
VYDPTGAAKTGLLHHALRGSVRRQCERHDLRQAKLGRAKRHQFSGGFRRQTVIPGFRSQGVGELDRVFAACGNPAQSRTTDKRAATPIPQGPEAEPVILPVVQIALQKPLAGFLRPNTAERRRNARMDVERAVVSGVLPPDACRDQPGGRQAIPGVGRAGPVPVRALRHAGGRVAAASRASW